jgi:plasmid stabilization system protein ParE
MTHRFHQEALEEFGHAVRFFENRQAGLGARFARSVFDTIGRIERNPELYRVVEGEVRRCLTRGFPYGVLYTIESDHVLIAAVMHLSREPGYWRKRVP